MQFNIISYLSSLTGFAFDRPVLERIAMERGVDDAESIEDLSQEKRDLLLADLLFVIFTSPSQSASMSQKHGSYSVSIGSQSITNKAGLYELMSRLYKKWNDPKLEDIEDIGELHWME